MLTPSLDTSAAIVARHLADPKNLAKLSYQEQLEAMKLLEALDTLKKQSKLVDYAPYPKQGEFHSAGAIKNVRERLLMAGNQLGKTWSAGMEVAMHLTGRYPSWWEGRRYVQPPIGWAASLTSQSTRDTVQRILLGQPGEWGTGAIPKDTIREIKKTPHGVQDAVETILVTHVSGGVSRVTLKTYDQGRERWQGETLDFVWFDEEPPEDIYMEGLTRTNATKGGVWMTFTPLLGMSAVVERFLVTQAPGTHVTQMTIDDALHYTQAERDAIVAAYPAHEREARAKGIPTLGSGRVFPILEETITTDAFPIPSHWHQIGGIDFGWDHPTACVHVAWDRDDDAIYVVKVHRVAQQTPLLIAAAVKNWGEWLPWAWPHDGLQHDKGSGQQLAQLYREQGLNFLPERATFEDGSNGVEAGVAVMLDYMQRGKFKVLSNCKEWFDEFRLYHRKDGKLVKERDDLISATRYAVMMLRNAVVKPSSAAAKKRRQKSWRVA